MKKFTQNLLGNYALIVLGAHVLPSVFQGDWLLSKYILELFIITVIIRLLMLLTDRFQSRYPILEYTLELGMVLAVVLGIGWMFEWYYTEHIPQMVITIVAVYVAVYAVGIGKIRHDVNFINEQIKRRRIKTEKKEGENNE
jgi:hypothetical protein